MFFDHVANAISKNVRRAFHEHQTQTPATNNYNIVYCVRTSAPSVEPIHALSFCPQQAPSTRWAIARDDINYMTICVITRHGVTNNYSVRFAAQWGHTMCWAPRLHTCLTQNKHYKTYVLFASGDNQCFVSFWYDSQQRRPPHTKGQTHRTTVGR